MRDARQVVLVQPGASFADGVALAVGPMPEDERQQFIRENSWRGRHDAILALAFADMWAWAWSRIRSACSFPLFPAESGDDRSWWGNLCASGPSDRAV